MRPRKYVLTIVCGSWDDNIWNRVIIFPPIFVPNFLGSLSSVDDALSDSSWTRRRRPHVNDTWCGCASSVYKRRRRRRSCIARARNFLGDQWTMQTSLG